MKREYKTGTRWCVWRWKEISFANQPYLDRLHLVHTPLGGVMVHWFKGPDPQRDRHDHPVNFWSFVLRGWYIEERPVGGHIQLRIVTRLNRMAATGVHRIVCVGRGTVTLVFYGPTKRKWGFHTKDGWEGWQSYNKRHGWT